VSALAFISLERAQADERFQPVATSPMQRRLAEAGAEFEERDGRLVATLVPGEDEHRIRVRDVTHLYRVEEAEGHVELALGEGGYGVRPPTGRGRTVVARLRDGAGELGESVMDMSAAWAALGVEGAGADRVLRRLTDLDLDDLPLVGQLAHIRALVARPDEDRFLIVFPQEYGHYLWEVVVDAVEPFGGGPAA
jgi:heterotetrameric sarcosine oxidase gamma subunit